MAFFYFMKSQHNIYRLVVIFFLTFIGCQDDEEPQYIGLPINTAQDSIVVNQGESIQISILDNDTNVSDSGTLSVSIPLEGSASIDEGLNTESVLDNTILYVANDTFVGDIEMTYTICNNATDCSTEMITITVQATNAVSVNLELVPYLKLSEYNFFESELNTLSPVPGVLPYEPISSLFSDYAHKKRFIWLPTNTKATYNGDAEPIVFPVGSVLIKNFFYENVLPSNTQKIIETRLMIRKEEGWTFAEYFWNDEQTEAFLDLEGDGGFKDITFIENGIKRSFTYRMPSGSQCFTCHKNKALSEPLGVKPQNLNADYDYNDGTQNQLQKWIDIGYLENTLPSDIHTVVDYTDTSQSLELRIRSYVDINCASCHRDEGHCNYRPMRFAFDENGDQENLGVCVEPDQFLSDLEDQKLIKPGDPENSVIYVRLTSIEENIMMPLLGRKLQHDEGIALLSEYINSLTDTCD
jgi:uncharacterized repeat protein (TIGR03806 family)